MPMIPLLKELIRETLLPGYAISLCQGEKVLMAIQLPSHFHIAALGEIQIADFVEQLLRREFAMHLVEMPGDFLSVVEIRVSQQVETVLTDSLGPSNDAVVLIRRPHLQ